MAGVRSISTVFLTWSSVILALKMSNLNDKRLYFYSQYCIFNQSPDLVRFCEGIPKKNQNRSGFSLVFLKFRSGFSLDLANLGPEYKVAALNLNK